MTKNNLRLYNILFPIWLFWLWPTVIWLIILPANFVIDTLVLVIALKVLHIGQEFAVWKRSIVKVWLIGFVSDFLGAAFILAIMLLLDAVGSPLNTILFPGTTIISIPGVLLSGILIYFFNRKLSFGRQELTAVQIHKLSLALAVFTAPYAMMIPLYG